MDPDSDYKFNNGFDDLRLIIDMVCHVAPNLKSDQKFVITNIKKEWVGTLKQCVDKFVIFDKNTFVIHG